MFIMGPSSLTPNLTHGPPSKLKNTRELFKLNADRFLMRFRPVITVVK